MKRNELVLLFLLFLFAFCLRFYDLSYPDFQWMDEKIHAPAATNYWDTGHFEPDNWMHPPLKYIILSGFIRLFGDNH
jgi:dolichyl-phosphate-mannose-protein mannosyltransferase